ncbi:MAG TPA: hypothetical protein VIT41_01940 [Microlunatus sp.]
MRERRWPWFVAATLLSGAAVTAAGATYLYWLPCRGSMVVGTAFSSGGDFPEDCLRRMDTGIPFVHDVGVHIPWVRELSLIAMAASSLAWLVLVLGLHWSVKTKLVAVWVSLPGLALAVAASRPNSADLLAEDSRDWPAWPLAVVVLLAVIAIYRWQPEVRGASFVQVLVLLWGATAFDFPHQAADYLMMVIWSSANWDIPPGTGVLTAATLAASAALTVVLTMWAPRLRDWPPQPDPLRSSMDPGLRWGFGGSSFGVVSVERVPPGDRHQHAVDGEVGDRVDQW